MEFRVIIPARYESSRLPGKVLIDIGGKTMLEHVYEKAVGSGAESVVIATDDQRVADAAEGFGAKVVMTASSHQSGTERLAEAVEALGYEPDEIVVGVQGDEPMMPSPVITQLAKDLAEHDNVKVASICEEITDPAVLFDPHAVKVILNRRHYAMFFTRAAVPWDLNTFDNPKNIELNGNYYRHVGLYAYRAGFLEDYINWPASPIESIESLEQLRILWNGGRIHMAIVDQQIPPGVDTEADLAVIRELVTQK